MLAWISETSLEGLPSTSPSSVPDLASCLPMALLSVVFVGLVLPLRGLIVFVCCFAVLPDEHGRLPFLVLPFCESLAGLPLIFLGSRKQGITTSSKSSTFEKT